MPQDATAVSSTATEAPPLTAVDQALLADDDALFFEAREAERAGTPLQPKPADSASAKPAEQAASTDAHDSPASEPGKTKGKGAHARNQELDAEIQGLQDKLKLRKALREELSTLERGGKVAESPAAKSAETPKRDYERYKAMPDAPKEDDPTFTDYSDYAAALAVFIADKRIEERDQRQQAEHYSQQERTLVERGKAAYEDFEDVLKSAQAAGVQFPPKVAQIVMTHEKGHEVAYALSKVFAELGDPKQVDAVIGRLLGESAHAPAASSPPSFSKAPEPPPTLGRKTTDLLDPEAAAVAADDDRAFFAARDAKRAAARR